MRSRGVHAFLVGEAFMRVPDPGAGLSRPVRLNAARAACRSEARRTARRFAIIAGAIRGASGRPARANVRATVRRPGRRRSPSSVPPPRSHGRVSASSSRVSKHWTTRRGAGPRGDGPVVRPRAGDAQRAARPLGLRQVDDAAPDRRARARRRGDDPRRRARCHVTAAGEAQHLDGVPVLRAVPAPDGRREHPLRPARAPGAGGGVRRDGSPRPRSCSASAALLERKPSQLSGGQQQRVALGRAIIAQRAGVPDGRAALQPRRAAARRDAAGDPRAAAQARHHDGLRHARPGRGDVDGRPRDPAERRAGSSRTARRWSSTRRPPTRSSRASSARRR